MARSWVERWGAYAAFVAIVVVVGIGFLRTQSAIDSINADRHVRIVDRARQDTRDAQIAKDAFVFNCARLDAAQVAARKAIRGGGDDLAAVINSFAHPTDPVAVARLNAFVESIKAKALARSETLKPIDCTYPPRTP